MTNRERLYEIAGRLGSGADLAVVRTALLAVIRVLLGALWREGEAEPVVSEAVLQETCAKAAHEANRLYCASIGDASQVPWDQAPEWQKESCRKGVVGALAGNTPEQSHEGWLAEKRATGWVYGPVKDPGLKTHPCMVPYSKLPQEQKAKDSIFLAIVRSVAYTLSCQGANDAAGVREGWCRAAPHAWKANGFGLCAVCGDTRASVVHDEPAEGSS